MPGTESVPSRTPRPARTAARTAAVVGAVAGMTAAFVAGFALGDDTGTPARRVVAAAPGTAQVSFTGTLGTADSCSDLLGWYVDRGTDLVGPWGWDDIAWAAEGGGADLGGIVPMPATGDSAATSELRAPTPGVTRSTSSATGTNVQEAGVDEPDVVKTDGDLLVRVQDGDLVTYDVSGDQVVRLGSLEPRRSGGRRRAAAGRGHRGPPGT